MMRMLVFSLTGMVVILFVAQFFNAKGTKSHIARGVMIGLLSLAVVVINTVDISLKRGLTWDAPFLAHTILGTLFFIGFGATAVTGYLVRRKGFPVSKHRFVVNATSIYLFLTLVTALALRFFR